MTTIFQKQSFLAVSALALMAGVALSVPNSVSAANLVTYDFEFTYSDTSTDSGFITIDKDDKSDFFRNVSYDLSVWNQPKWVDFSVVYRRGDRVSTDDRFATPDSFFTISDFSNDPYGYSYYGSFLAKISLFNNSFSGQASATGYKNSGFYDTGDGGDNIVTSFTLTPRAVPVPGFAFGIVAAGGWLASKQLRRKTQTAKQSVSA